MNDNQIVVSKFGIKLIYVQKILIIATLFYVNFAQYKIYQNSLILALLGGCSIALYLFSVLSLGKLFFNKYICLYLLFMVYMLFPTVIRGAVPVYISSLSYTFLMLCIIHICYIDNNIDWLTKTKFIMTIFTCIVFLMQPAVYHDKINTIQYSLVSTLNPNTFGLDIVFGLWCSLELFSKNKIKRYTLIGSIFLFTVTVIKTASRKSLICTLLALCFWAWFYYIRDTKLHKIKITKIFKGIVLLLVIIIAGYFFFANFFAGSTMERRIYNMFSGDDRSIATRYDMYIFGFSELFRYPIFGYGFDGFRSLYGSYSHATIVEVPVSGGCLGGILYFSIFVGSLMRTIKRTRSFKWIDVGQDIMIEHYMAIILWIMMFFLCICVIHPYLFNSHVMLAILFAVSMKYEKGNLKAENKAERYFI